MGDVARKGECKVKINNAWLVDPHDADRKRFKTVALNATSLSRVFERVTEEDNTTIYYWVDYNEARASEYKNFNGRVALLDEVGDTPVFIVRPEDEVDFMDTISLYTFKRVIPRTIER